MDILITFLFLIFIWIPFFSITCFKLAIQRNKNSIVAAFVGIFFGLFGLLYYGLSLKEE